MIFSSKASDSTTKYLLPQKEAVVNLIIMDFNLAFLFLKEEANESYGLFAGCSL